MEKVVKRLIFLAGEIVVIDVPLQKLDQSVVAFIRFRAMQTRLV